MKKFLFKANVPLILICLLAFSLRFYKYDYFPVGGETADESAWSLLGSSLLQTGKPASWSYFEPYKDYVVQERVNEKGPKEAPIVSPALDHPPLFSLIPGFFHSLKYSWLSMPSIKLIRLPMVFLGTFNVALLFVLSQKLFSSKKTALLATLIYAMAPAFVFSSRLVVAENLLTTFSLFALILLVSKNTKKTTFWLVVVGILSIFTKVSGVGIPVSIFLYGLALRKKEIYQAGLLGMIFGVGLYILYGAIFNFSLFWLVQTAQAGRELGLATLQNRLFLHPTLVSRTFFDGWEILGLFSLFYLFSQKDTQKKLLVIKIFSLVNFIFIAATVGETTFHGWYNNILFPVFSLSMGWAFHRLWEQQNYWLLGFTWLFLLPLFRLALVHSDAYQEMNNMHIRIILLIGFLPLAFDLLKQQKLAKIAALSLLSLVFLANVMTLVNFTQKDYWEGDEYFLPSRVVK